MYNSFVLTHSKTKREVCYFNYHSENDIYVKPIISHYHIHYDFSRFLLSRNPYGHIYHSFHFFQEKVLFTSPAWGPQRGTLG